MKLTYLSTCLVGVLLLTACGGGGGSSASSSPSPSPPATTPANTAPTATNISLTIDEDTTGTGQINASDADGDALTYTVQTGTQNGALTLNADGSFTYEPNADYFGNDSATIVVSDGTNSTTLTIALTINDVVDTSAPVATIAARPDITASIPTEFSGTTDADETLTYSWSLTAPQYSEAAIDDASAQTVTIRPDAIGVYRLSLRVTNSAGQSDTTEITFTPDMPEPMPLPDFAPSPPPTGFINDQVDAVRLLKQATFGPTVESVARLEELGGEAWFQEQMSMEPTLWVDQRDIVTEVTGDYEVDGNGDPAQNGKEWIREIFNMTAYDAPDQLRHRVAFALSQLFVVSTQTDLGHRDIAFTTYWDLLARHAFGNFRNLLENVTLHPTMGHYLNMMGNQKADPARNIRPDENFAREVMQLFTIGLAELNQDGSIKMDEMGEPIETYTQETIQNYAAALTGWYYTTPEIEANGREGYRGFDCSVHCHPYASSGMNMVAYQQIHQKTEKNLLRGYYIPPGQTAEQDLEIVMDSLFNHPNLAPFFAQHLIRQMVTSNPTPEYVARVSAVFNNNGEGVRGDIAATVKAVLFDQEARNPESVNVPLYGKLKEPVLKKTHFVRLFDIKLLNEPTVNIDNLWGSIPWCPLGCNHTQEALNSDSVFNFFRPDFAPNGAIAQMELAAPEAQILTESNVVREVQTVRWLKTPLTWEWEISNGWVEREWDATGFDPKPLIDTWDENGFEGVIDFLNLYLLAGGMTEEYKQALLDIQTIQDYQHVFDGEDPAWDPTSSDIIERHDFLIDLIYMVMSSSEFRIQQ